MGVTELAEPLANAEEGRARAVSDITVTKADPKKVQNAMIWTAISVVCSLAVGMAFSFAHPRKHDAMMEFYAGYILEASLSLDNLFAFYLEVLEHQVERKEVVQRQRCLENVTCIELHHGVVLSRMGEAECHANREGCYDRDGCPDHCILHLLGVRLGDCDVRDSTGTSFLGICERLGKLGDSH